MLLETSFIDRFNQLIFSSKRNVNLWHTQLVAIFVSYKNSMTSNPTAAFVKTPIVTLTRPILKLKRRKSRFVWHLKRFYNLTMSVVWLLPHQPPLLHCRAQDIRRNTWTDILRPRSNLKSFVATDPYPYLQFISSCNAPTRTYGCIVSHGTSDVHNDCFFHYSTSPPNVNP